MEVALIISSILLWVMVFLNILFVLGISRRLNLLVPRPQIEGMKVGDVVPDFRVNTIEGHIFSSVDFNGQYGALAFLSPKCTPCIGELPKLYNLTDKIKDGISVVLIADSNPSETKEFVKDRPNKLVVVSAPFETSPLLTQLKAFSTPLFYLINSSRKIEFVGSDVTELETQLPQLSIPQRR